jgi:hypothetical protein
MPARRGPISAAMERRKDARIDIDQDVTLTVLSAPGLTAFQAKAVEMSDGGMRIVSPVPVNYQAAVQIRAGDFLLLGEVIRSQVLDGCHLLVIKLQHSLDSLGDLRRLNRALRWEDRETAPVVRETVTQEISR